MGRSSFAIAMKDYTFIRPGIAVTLSALTLVIALILGIWLIASLRRAASTVERGARTSQTLHAYNAGLEVWRDMMTSTDPAYKRPEAVAQRDSLGRTLRQQLARVQLDMTDPQDQERVHQVLEGLTRTDNTVTTQARSAMIVLLAKQDSALFQAARASQQAVLLSAGLLAAAIVAAGLLVIPMAWLYIRYKRGATIEVKV